MQQESFTEHVRPTCASPQSSLAPSLPNSPSMALVVASAPVEGVLVVQGESRLVDAQEKWRTDIDEFAARTERIKKVTPAAPKRGELGKTIDLFDKYLASCRKLDGLQDTKLEAEAASMVGYKMGQSQLDECDPCSRLEALRSGYTTTGTDTEQKVGIYFATLSNTDAYDMIVNKHKLDTIKADIEETIGRESSKHLPVQREAYVAHQRALELQQNYVQSLSELGTSPQKPHPEFQQNVDAKKNELDAAKAETARLRNRHAEMRRLLQERYDQFDEANLIRRKAVAETVYERAGGNCARDAQLRNVYQLTGAARENKKRKERPSDAELAPLMADDVHTKAVRYFYNAGIHSRAKRAARDTLVDPYGVSAAITEALTSSTKLAAFGRAMGERLTIASLATLTEALNAGHCDANDGVDEEEEE